jgi:tRNA threonylcarbamoyladenosine biosynthesis protein TsaE
VTCTALDRELRARHVVGVWSTFCPDPDATRDLGSALGRSANGAMIVALNGDLGAGKTCFAQGVGLALGVAQPVVSPTFVLIAEYDGRLPLLHADCYRLGPADLPHIGLEELLETWPGVALVEWAGRFDDLLPADHIRVDIEVLDDGRRFEVSATGPVSAAVVRRWRAAAEEPAGGV